jgi:hypothetical protein
MTPAASRVDVTPAAVFMWVMLAPGFAVSAYATLEPTTRLITVAILRIVLRI